MHTKKPPDYPDTALRRLADEHCTWLKVTNHSDQTVRNRRVYLGYFFEWCEERGLISPGEINRPILERYQRYLYRYRKKNGNPLGVSSQHVRLRQVRAFFKWLARYNHILYNPAAELQMPKLGRRIPHAILSISEAEQVLIVPDTTTALGLRDRAILEVFYSTGIRRCELAALGLYDIDYHRGTVYIRQGKGSKDRTVPIGDRAAFWVTQYVDNVRPRLVVGYDEGILFLSEQGIQFELDWLTRLVRNYVNEADIGKKGSCHLFRHTMATMMLDNGADLRYIQEMLGHVKIETTQIYTYVSIHKLKQIHTATHPAATFNRG